MDIRRWLKTNWPTYPEKNPAVTASKVSSNPDRAEPLAGAGFEFPPLAVTTQPLLALSSETPFTSHSDPPGVTTPSASSSPPPIISYKFWWKESVHMPTSWVPTGAFIGLCDNVLAENMMQCCESFVCLCLFARLRGAEYCCWRLWYLMCRRAHNANVICIWLFVCVKM